MKIWVGALITGSLLVANAVFAALNVREIKQDQENLNRTMEQFNQREEMRKKMEQYTGFY